LDVASSRDRRIRWRRVAWWALGTALPLFLAFGLWGASAWAPLIATETGLAISEGILRAFLVGYFGLWIGVPLAMAILVRRLARAGQGPRRHPRLAKAVLASGAILIGLVLAELSASAWLAWLHRMPALPTRFAHADGASSPGEISLVVLGESSAAGYPYNPTLSIGTIVGDALEARLPGPGGQVRVNVLAKVGANLEQMHRALAAIERQPDAILVYCGHNEYLTRFEASRNAGPIEGRSGPFLRWLHQVSLASPLCRLIRETLSKHRLGAPPPPVNHHDLIDPPAFTAEEDAEILADFERRLDAIVSYARLVGAVPILVIPPANESGFEPNRTTLSDAGSVSQAASNTGDGSSWRDAATESFQEARAIETSNSLRARSLYEQLVQRWSDFAEAHFRLARLLEAAGNAAEARRHYVAARDRDGFPIRLRTDFMEAYRRIAKKHDAILVDGPEVLRRLSPQGILGDDLFHDAHHPTLRGHVALAEAVVREIETRKALGLSPTAASEVSLDPAAVATRFKLDRDAWVRVCARSATFYRDLAPVRYDPSERKAKQQAYEEARLAIEAGAEADTVAVPGVGLRQVGSLRRDWWKVPPGDRVRLPSSPFAKPVTAQSMP
jgi:hypothetical protein